MKSFKLITEETEFLLDSYEFQFDNSSLKKERCFKVYMHQLQDKETYDTVTKDFMKKCGMIIEDWDFYNLNDKIYSKESFYRYMTVFKVLVELNEITDNKQSYKDMCNSLFELFIDIYRKDDVNIKKSTKIVEEPQKKEFNLFGITFSFNQ